MGRVGLGSSYILSCRVLTDAKAFEHGCAGVCPHFGSCTRRCSPRGCMTTEGRCVSTSISPSLGPSAPVPPERRLADPEDDEPGHRVIGVWVGVGVAFTRRSPEPFSGGAIASSMSRACATRRSGADLLLRLGELRHPPANLHRRHPGDGHQRRRLLGEDHPRRARRRTERADRGRRVPGAVALAHPLARDASAGDREGLPGADQPVPAHDAGLGDGFADFGRGADGGGQHRAVGEVSARSRPISSWRCSTSCSRCSSRRCAGPSASSCSARRRACARRPRRAAGPAQRSWHWPSTEASHERRLLPHLLALPGPVDRLDAGAFRAGLRAGQPRRLCRDARPHFAAGLASPADDDLHRSDSGHSAPDPALHRLFRFSVYGFRCRRWSPPASR